MQLRVLCLGAVPLESKCLFVSDFMGQPCFKVGQWYEKSLLVSVRGATRDQVVHVRTQIPYSPELLSGEYISRANAVFVLLDADSNDSLMSAQRYFRLLEPYQSTVALVFVGLTDTSSLTKNMPIAAVEKYAWEMQVMFVEVNLITGRHVRASYVVLAKKAASLGLLEPSNYSSNPRHQQFMAWRPKVRASSPHTSEPNSSSAGNTPRSQLFQSEMSPFRCVRERKMDRLEQLLHKGININSGDEGSLNTLLHLSCLYCDSTFVKFLLERHAHVNIANAFGQTPLHCAARRISRTPMRLLVEGGADPNARDVYGNTAVHVAAEFGNVDALQFLDESGADLGAVTDKGNSAVHIAAYWGHEEVLLFLHQKGLALDVENKSRRVPFMLAASTGAVACCRYIARVLSEVPAKWFSRSLLLTASAGHTECCQYLLKSQPGCLSLSDEMHALRCALLNKQKSISLFLVNRWLENPDGVYEELKNHDLVVLSVEAGLSQVLSTLVELGADHNSTRHPQGMTPFLLAARHGSIELMKTLLGHGCDAHAKDSLGFSALHHAAYSGHVVAIDKLLNLGMNPNAHNSNRQSALMVAVGQGHAKALYKLLDHIRSGVGVVDPIGLLKTWKDPYLMVVNELASSELVKGATLWRARGFTVGIGTFKGIHVLTYKFEPPVDIRSLGIRVGIMSHFRHPNIATLLGVLSDGVSYTMVQETGTARFGTLFDVIYREKRVYEPMEIIALCLKLLKGLKNMHQEFAGKPAVVHRDIRSGNVLLHPQHGPILFNFATASFFTQDVVLAHHGRIGTVGWMAPEVLMGEPFSSKVDIYSFGMLIYEIYEGKMPFEGYHVFDIAPKVIRGDTPRFHKAKSKEEAFLVEMMMRCWAHRPSARPSFKELRRHFSQMLEGVDRSETISSPPNSPHIVEGGQSSFLDPKIKCLGVVDSKEVSQSSINPNPAKNQQEAIMLYRYEIEGMEYYTKEIPLRIIDPRRFHIFQLRAHDIETLTESLSQRKQSHILRLLFNDVNAGYVRLITHRYDTTLYDKLRLKATRERMHFSAAQVLDMAKQLIQGLMFLNSQDPPIHHFISDRDVFLRESPGENPWLMLGDFGLTHLLTAKIQEAMLGDGGFIAPEVLQSSSHRFNTVTDRNHALASEATDVFAFGMVIHTILRLSRPFSVEANNCVKQQVELEPTSLSASYRPLIDLALKCTQFYPKSRPTLKEALQMLEKMKNLSTTPDKFRPRMKRAKSSFSVNPLTNVPGQDSTAAAAEPISLPIHMRMPGGKMLLTVPNYYLECGAFIAGGASKESDLTPEAILEHYTRHMAETTHTCFTGTGEKGPVIIIISKEMTSYRDEPGYRCLSRAPTGDEKFFLSSSIRALMPTKKGAPCAVPTSKQLLKALNTFYDRFEKYNLKCAGEVMNEAQINLLVDLEKQCISRTYTIGVVYAAPGQQTISEMLSNERAPPALQAFMETLGERVKLCNFSQFAGGLDTKYDSTGTSSYYTRIHRCEVMFHVAQMLPYEIEDPQLQRKRFLSQNVCIIVFQDGDAQPLSPDICSDWPKNHVLAVVRPVQEKVKHTRVKDLVGMLRSRSPDESPPNSPGRQREKLQCYQLSFAWKQELRPFAPHLENPIFEAGSFLRHFLLTKLLNGQRAAYVGDTTLRVEREVTRAELLSQLGNNLIKCKTKKKFLAPK